MVDEVKRWKWPLVRLVQIVLMALAGVLIALVHSFGAGMASVWRTVSN